MRLTMLPICISFICQISGGPDVVPGGFLSARQPRSVSLLSPDILFDFDQELPDLISWDKFPKIDVALSLTHCRVLPASAGFSVRQAVSVMFFERP